MSSFRKALKSRQRNHHERSQPSFRKNLGLLEKKKDYKLRANDHHKKQNTLAALRKKALEKNPDEFYYKMISSKLEDGVHVMKEAKEEVEVTEEQKKVMRTQDIKYVEMKRVAESKKIERLKGELHLLDAESKQKNKHTFFVDSKKQVQTFNLASHLDTAPELVDRVYNRPTLKTLETRSIQGAVDPRSVAKLAKQGKHQYKILSQRIDREKKMFVISQKIQTRKDLQDKTKKVKVKKETTTTAAIYKFEAKRKR
ncbi:probable U3 small nucleolar RNA-associated protein 11 [Melanotaenia boesemani]|uniref:probable U3 small nucleolar RNA-associated protein 11 n=1 Tax=Melanotaenia boesemani TaxID=1250792 RepID=UPI001C049795|nr:probable U3 small nucleolar RNA-associated protein 11 [Melanotaenia boesemani]